MAKKKSGKWFYVLGAILIGTWFFSRLNEVGSEASSVDPSTNVVDRSPPAVVPDSTPVINDLVSASVSATPTPSASPSPSPRVALDQSFTFNVAGIAPGDFLNLRKGPGENHPIVQRLENGVDGITLVGQPVNNGDTVWQKINSRGVEGWVVVNHLSQSVPRAQQAQPPKAIPAIREANPPSDNFIPKEVRLTSATSFPKFERGVQVGLRAAPVGTKVTLVKITGYNVVVKYQGTEKSIQASSTDLLEQMLGTVEN